MEYKIYNGHNPSIKIDRNEKDDLIKVESKCATIETPNRNKRSYSYSKACTICDEPVKLTEEEVMTMMSGRSIGIKICDECKQAILYMRKQIKENDK